MDTLNPLLYCNSGFVIDKFPLLTAHLSGLIDGAVSGITFVLEFKVNPYPRLFTLVADALSSILE